MIEGTQLAQKSRIHIEIASIPSYENYPRILNFSPPHLAIQGETKQEILADKITAIGRRSYLKGKDLWDIYSLYGEKNIEIPWNIITKKIKDYNVSNQAYQNRLEQRKNELSEQGLSLLSFELKRFLSRPVYNQYENQFPTIIQTVLTHILSKSLL